MNGELQDWLASPKQYSDSVPVPTQTNRLILEGLNTETGEPLVWRGNQNGNPR